MTPAEYGQQLAQREREQGYRLSDTQVARAARIMAAAAVRQRRGEREAA